MSTRRDFLAQSLTLSAVAMRPFGDSQTFGAESNSKEIPPLEFPRGKAEHCVFVWLGGGQGHIDTWDPKAKGDPKGKKPGSYYDSIETAVPGTRVCEHLPKCATILDRFNIVRTVNHDVIDEHAAATNRMHTGRPTGGTEIYPSIGSIVAHQRGALAEGVPAYVLMGYPNVTRGPGFLGPKHSYVHLTDTKSGPPALKRARDITEERQARRNRLLNSVREELRSQKALEGQLAEYDSAIAAAQKLAGPEFMRLFDLDREPAELRNEFGGEFGQRCLLARRLIEGGTRFIEVSHNLNFLNGTGWDVHNEGIEQQHALIRELDQALAALVSDLERKKLLDKTLVVVATEFGRPAQFDGGGGRGHHSKSFSCVLAGGGLKNGITIGETDELGMKIVARPVSVPDLHATIHCCLGINPREELHSGNRPVPLTDNGEPVRELFSYTPRDPH